MIDGARAVSVLAFADELGADPALLRTWAATFTGEDEITLVIHPGQLEAGEVADRVVSAMTAAGIADDPACADLIALTGPLAEPTELALAADCRAVYSRRPAAVPYAQLRHADQASVAELRALLPKPPVPRHTTIVPGGWTVVHRGTHADVGVLSQIFAEENYSLKRFDRWPGLARYGDRDGLGGRPLIVDCGANIGASSMYFSIRHPDALIVAVEPEPDNYALLCENTAAFPNVVPVNCAIASERGSLVLSDPGTGGWAFRTGADIAKGRIVGEVEAITVDDVLAAHPDAVPFILKVDIEGAEGDLFSAATASIGRFPLLIIELHDWLIPGGGTSRNFLRWQAAQERDFVHFGENAFSLDSGLVAA